MFCENSFQVFFCISNLWKSFRDLNLERKSSRGLQMSSPIWVSEIQFFCSKKIKVWFIHGYSLKIFFFVKCNFQFCFSDFGSKIFGHRIKDDQSKNELIKLGQQENSQFDFYWKNKIGKKFFVNFKFFFGKLENLKLKASQSFSKTPEFVGYPFKKKSDIPLKKSNGTDFM